ncbi:hypothetical protein [Treponema pedis]|uniref:hypothetical protein n=1 Tax=Treponema pedis TaxID=409322 RepID=UPI0004127895|nr:hypothetical protein [Treponema pedis]
MKKICITLLFACTLGLYAQTAMPEDAKGIGLGFALNANGRSDFGITAEITAPWFFKNSFSFKTGGGIFFRKTDAWKPYYSLDFYFLGGTLMKTANIRLYGGGGPIFLFPASAGEKPVMFGGAGFFGFEFYMAALPVGSSYFIELGGSGFAASKRLDVNGFTVKTGFRYCIPFNKSSGEK